MTVDPNLEKNVEDTGRPDLTLALEIANFVREELRNMETHLNEQLRVAMQATTATVKRIEMLEGSFQHLNDDLQRRAAERADKDVMEAQARLQIAQAHKDGLSTQEKIDVTKLMEDRDLADRKERANRRRAFWDKITPNIASAMILAVLIPVWLAFVILVLVFVLRALGVQVQFP